jgi:hypothetical protein
MIPLGLLLLAAPGGCTVPDDIIENKRCHPTLGNTECIQGYTCQCQMGDCRCQRGGAQPVQQMQNFPLRLAPEPAEQPAFSASLRLLQRCGALPRQPIPGR